MRKLLACLFACSAMIFACSGGDGPTAKAPEGSGGAASAAGPMKVTMWAVYNGGGEKEMSLEVKQPLVNGDQIAYHVTADRDAYVYVVQFLADGSGHLIYPDTGEQLVKANAKTRVPADGWLELFGCAGDETAFVVASERPLNKSDQELEGVIAELKSAPEHKTSCGPDGRPIADLVGELDLHPQRGLKLPSASGEPATPASASASASASAAAPPPPVSATAAPSAPPPRVKPPKLPVMPAPSHKYVAFRKRSICVGRPECVKARALKHVSNSYKGEADDNGIAVIEFGFKHETGKR